VTVLLITLIVYLLGIVVVQTRLLLVLRRVRRQIIENGMAININNKGYRWVAFLDAAKWPHYVLWHGLKSLIEDLK
jgi:hypothetical protein